MNGSDKQIMTGSRFGTNTRTPGLSALSFSGTTLLSGSVSCNEVIFS